MALGAARPGWLGVIALLTLAPAVHAQRPHIGYCYPAGGQQATTVQVRLGGQSLDDVDAVLVTGSGVSGRVVDFYRRLNNQEVQLIREQMQELKKAKPAAAPAKAADLMAENSRLMSALATEQSGGKGRAETAQELIARIEKRTREWVQVPACASISSLAFLEITISPEAEPGVRELRLVTPRGVSNPLAFHVGQLREYARPPMISATIQTLGKEEQALRKRPASEAEVRIALPCTVNGQIASGEVNRYRFEASKGQRLVLSAQARQLIPYIADAVPGWFQPVLALYDSRGKEVAFADDYRFRPDPVILFEVPEDGEYVFAMYDSIYRGREDFVYRITVGELPFVTSIFPLGAQVGSTILPDMEGWNVRDGSLGSPNLNAPPGLQSLAAYRLGYDSNRVPFILDTLPDAFDRESNDSIATAQPVTLPVVINGRIDRSDDWDVYQFAGKAKDQIVAEVQARRLDSPLDSVIKLTDASGRLLAFNDDREDLTAGLNTHHADSLITAKLPADGTYYLHIGDTARKGGVEYGYRLRLGPPQPDFELRVVPSSVSIQANSTAALTVYAARSGGYTGPIKLTLQDPPAGISAAVVFIGEKQTTARLVIKAGAGAPKAPVALSVFGSIKIGNREISRPAVAAEDKMQAFLWRHLVPAQDLQALVFDPRYQPPPKRIPPPRPATIVAGNAAPTPSPMPATSVAATTSSTSGTPASAASSSTTKPPEKSKFTKQQVSARLRQLKLLYEEGLLTDSFYDAKVAECEAGT